jgi:hypothetical protein
MTERYLQIGDQVLLKVQPYAQAFAVIRPKGFDEKSCISNMHVTENSISTDADPKSQISND